MLLNNSPAAKRLRGDQGFTLVELLVVIVIIGILVAIAVPIFLNQRAAAQRSAVESDVRNAIPVMETYYAENGSYPENVEQTGAGEAIDLGDDLRISVSDSVTLDIDVNGESYTVMGQHTALEGEAFTYDSEDGKIVEGSPED
ncbi:type IV pilin protein [Microbacterium karelineae]|uniref:type IV pilin protein n=1 Tax=Microbacterium karelineae TaxID=2654283 RepID=UPI0012EA5DC5|nr:prepilin-type N-terminal cleavage/methylation domain-containing protein [Microbacterium karelineae]